MDVWNYSGDPDSSAKDQVRFLIGDTDSKDKLLNDAEIRYLLKLYNQFPMNAAIRACEVIIAKFSRLADETVGQVRITFSQKAKAYATLRAQLQERLAIEGATPFAGGISKTQKQSNEYDEDRVRPDFSKHMMENHQVAPWTSQPYDLWLRGSDE